MFGFIKRWIEKRKRRQEEERAAVAEAHDREKQRIVKQREIKNNILAILAEDKIPDIDWQISIGNLPFRFMKSEHLIYVFPAVRYYEQRTKREFKGRSAGTSVRVMKGVSVRVGQSRGTPIESDEIIDRGIGMLAVTNKHIYFDGERTFRVNFSKIVAVDRAGDNAVSITRDRASAHPEFFVVGEQDAAFAYKLLQAIPSLELGRGEPERQAPSDYHLLMQDAETYIYDE